MTQELTGLSPNERLQKIYEVNEKLYKIYDWLWKYKSYHERESQMTPLLDDMETCLLDVWEMTEPFSKDHDPDRSKKIDEMLKRMDLEGKAIVSMIESVNQDYKTKNK
jgi:hypothetical protein